VTAARPATGEVGAEVGRSGLWAQEDAVKRWHVWTRAYAGRVFCSDECLDEAFGTLTTVCTTQDG
jgi:hypothetical protein